MIHNKDQLSKTSLITYILSQLLYNSNNEKKITFSLLLCIIEAINEQAKTLTLPS